MKRSVVFDSHSAGKVHLVNKRQPGFSIGAATRNTYIATCRNNANGHRPRVCVPGDQRSLDQRPKDNQQGGVVLPLIRNTGPKANHQCRSNQKNEKQTPKRTFFRLEITERDLIKRNHSQLEVGFEHQAMSGQSQRCHNEHFLFRQQFHEPAILTPRASQIQQPKQHNPAFVNGGQMKHEAISRRELPRLIRQIHQAGRFEASRGGHQVEIATERSLTAEPIKYGVCIRRRWTRGQAATVGEAVDRINQLARRTA